MKLQELIDRLTELAAEHGGDVEVKVSVDDVMGEGWLSEVHADVGPDGMIVWLDGGLPGDRVTK